MSLSTNLISGLSSGFDWRSVIDQLMEIERRPVDLVENQKSEYEEKLEIFQTLNTSLLSFKAQATSLAKTESFNLFTASLTTTSSSYSASDFLTVSTTSSAAPGTHTITMNSSSSIAQARMLSSKSFTSYDTALGLTGEFVINGRAVKVEATDDLDDLRDKINTLNSGAYATGVTASLLTVDSGNYRLILTSDNTGQDVFTIFDASSDAQNILSTGLGFADETTSVKNLLINGAQSEEFSSSSVSMTSMLGLSTSQSGTVWLGAAGNPNRIDVAVDLDNSLTEIASAINARSTAVGSNITASVASSTEDGVTTYSLKILGTTSFTDSNHVLETLGILQGDQADVAEFHEGSAALYDGSDVLLDTDNANLDTIDLTDLRISAGTSAGVALNDTIRVTGTKGDGTAVDASFQVGVTGSTVQSFLTWLDTQFSGGGNNVTVRLDDGKINIEDDEAGDSQLSILITANNESGAQLSFGTVSATTQGYSMELQGGADASIVIDGTAVRSSSNIIQDVIPGVTINLLTVEAGSTVNLAVSRDQNGVVSSVQDLLDAYNEVIAAIHEQVYYNQETETAGPLQGDSTLLSIKAQMVEVLTQTITGLPSTLNSLSLVGINSKIDYSDHSSDGQLTLDQDAFLAAFNSNFLGLRRVFIAEGSTTDGDVEYISHSNQTVAGEYAVSITTVPTRAGVTGTEVLTAGVGAADIEVLTVTQGDKTAAVVLNGASGENGGSIDDIVNALNSEFDAEHAQSLMGNVKNTTDAGGTTAIASTTTWDSIFSGGSPAGVAQDQIIAFEGHKRNGTFVSGTYTIGDTATDTIQGLLSAVESTFDNEVSASINTYGYLVITDKTTGGSSIDFQFTQQPGSLDFGAVTTSNLVGSARNVDGASAITETNTWNELDGHSLVVTDVIKFAGYTSDGTAVEGSYTINDLGDPLSDFLSAIETAYGGSVDASFQDGRLMLTDGTTNSALGITIFEPSGRGLDFGTISGGVTGRYAMDVTVSKDGSDHLVLTHEDYGSATTFTLSQSGADLGLGAVTAGVDVAGTVNGQAATGAGQILTGAAPAEGQTTSVEGLVIKFTGTTTGAQGNVKITMGAAELFQRALYDITNTIDGYLDYRMESMTERIDDFEDRIADMEARLNLKMENMVNRFVAMELALAQIQNMSNWLSGQVNAASNGWG